VTYLVTYLFTSSGQRRSGLKGKIGRARVRGAPSQFLLPLARFGNFPKTRVRRRNAVTNRHKRLMPAHARPPDRPVHPLLPPKSQQTIRRQTHQPLRRLDRRGSLPNGTSRPVHLRV